MRYRWTTLWVRDMERSLAFYRDVLGLTVDSRHGDSPEIVMLGPPEGPMLELICAQDAPPDPSPGKGVSVGYAVDDLDGMIERVRAAGYAVSPLTVLPGIRFAFATCPDGYSIQLVDED